MSVRLSLLAILDQGACYGYQLRTELDRRTGSPGPINVGQIYNTLDRLERDKLVRKTEQSNYYEITPAGTAAVAAWWRSPSALAELPAKLALASTLPGVDVRAISRTQRSAISESQNSSTLPTDALGLAAAIVGAATDTESSAARELLDRIDSLLDLGIAPLALATDVPKRGRPPKKQNG